MMTMGSGEEGEIYKEDYEIDKEDGELELLYKNKLTSIQPYIWGHWW